MAGKSRSYDDTYKLVIIGDSEVGKSCLRLQFIAGRFQPVYDQTNYIEFDDKTLKLLEHKKIKLQIRDTAGDKKLRRVTESFYSGADACLLVYDITKRSTFDNLPNWLKSIGHVEGVDSERVIMLVANKTDLSDQREVTTEEGKQFADENKLLFIETSAKNAFNVKNAFHESAEKIYKKKTSAERTVCNRDAIARVDTGSQQTFTTRKAAWAYFFKEGGHGFGNPITAIQIAGMESEKAKTFLRQRAEVSTEANSSSKIVCCKFGL